MTAMQPDLYAILGVAPAATQAQISSAYRALLRRHHPDTRPRDDDIPSAVSDAALQQVLAAYTVLHDPVRRAAYDRRADPRRSPICRRPQQALNRYGAQSQPPIIAGPVRWHRTR